MKDLSGVAVEGIWVSDSRSSFAVISGGFIFVSGQGGFDPDGRIVGPHFLAQARQTFENLRLVLEAAGSSLDRVVRLGIFLTDMRYLSELRDVIAEYHSEAYPADSAVGVTALAQREALVEIDAIARVG